MQFLIFTLFAPFGAIGEIAVGERRMSWNRPAKSAVLGIVGAALGLDRSAEEEHRALHEQFHYAVEVNRFGKSVVDFHTAQAPFGKKAESAVTRAQELSTPQSNLHTIVSTREWRADSFFIAVLWRSEAYENVTRPMQTIQEAMLRPAFTLSMGRKSAPFGLPLYPRIIDAPNLLEALNELELTDLEQEVMKALAAESVRTVAFDLKANGVPAGETLRVERRRDAILNRSRWQFDERDEGIVELAPREFEQGDNVPI